VELKDGKIERIEGNRCPRGEAYAREEITDPKRVLATSVKVLGGDYPLVSVRTDRPIPKRLIPTIMEIVRGLCVKAPVEIGQVLVANLAGTGANLIATRRVLPRSEKAEELPRKKKA
jgi:CxxC motif-containing protein